MTTRLKIARAYSVLVLAGVVGHLLSLFKEILGAKYFGVSSSMDAFYAALTVPNMLTGVFVSPFSVIFIPILARYRDSELPEGCRVISAVSNLIFLVLLAAAGVSFFFAAPVIALVCPGLPGPVAVEAASMLRIMSASVFFTGAVNILGSVLNAFESFLWPAVSGMFITLVTIAFLLFLTGKLGVSVLAWGLLCGSLLQVLFLLPFVLRRGFIYSPGLRLDHPEIRRSIKLALIFLGISLFGGIVPVINRLMASWLPAGSIAALAYADKLMQVPLIIFSGAIATSIYPFLSSQAAEGRLDEMADTVALGVRMGGFIFIPIAFILIALGRPLIQLLLQRGAFDAAATGLTSVLFACYCLLLLSNYAAALLLRTMYAFQDFRSLFIVTTATVAATAALNLVFIRLLNPPAAGIALSASAASLLNAVLCYFAVRKRIPRLKDKAIIKPLLFSAAAGGPAGLAAFLFYSWLAPGAPASLPKLAFAVAASGAAGLTVFSGLAAAFRLEEYERVRRLAADKFRQWGARHAS